MEPLSEILSKAASKRSHSKVASSKRRKAKAAQAKPLPLMKSGSLRASDLEPRDSRTASDRAIGEVEENGFLKVYGEKARVGLVSSYSQGGKNKHQEEFKDELAEIDA